MPQHRPRPVPHASFLEPARIGGARRSWRWRRSRCSRPPVSPGCSTPVLALGSATFAAGEEILISGTGFAPLEAVTVRVVHADGTAEGGMGHESWLIVAGASGDVEVTWSIAAGEVAGQQFVVEAVGAVSGPGQAASFARGPIVTTDRSTYVAGDGVWMTGRDFARR